MIIIGTILLITCVLLLVRSEGPFLPKPKKKKEKITDPRADALIKILDEKSNLIHKFYIERFIGEERLKDTEWMTRNGYLGREVPTHRRYQIQNEPSTAEGEKFRVKINRFQYKYGDFRKMGADELSKLNDEVEDSFPEVFVAIKRENKLKELGI